MQIDHVDRVALAGAEASAVWERLVEVHAVSGLLTDRDEVRDAGPLAAEGEAGAVGHSFRVSGRGGGRFHARVEECAEEALLSYVVWRDDMPESPMLLTFELLEEDGEPVLRGSITGDIPVREVLEEISPLLGLAAPLAERLARDYLARRLRGHLEGLVGGG